MAPDHPNYLNLNENLFIAWTRAPVQYPIRRLIVRSRVVSKPRCWWFELSHRVEIWEEPRQQCCRGACQIPGRLDDYNHKPRGFEASRDLTIWRLIGYWSRSQVSVNEDARNHHILLRPFPEIFSWDFPEIFTSTYWSSFPRKGFANFVASWDFWGFQISTLSWRVRSNTRQSVCAFLIAFLTSIITDFGMSLWIVSEFHFERLHRTHGAMITSLWRQNDITTSFWRHNDVIIASCARCSGLLMLLPSHMMTSSNGNIFRVTGHLCWEFTGPGEFPAQRPVTRSFDVFFDLRLNKRLSKQPRGWWFETLSWSLWRQCNDLDLFHVEELWHFQSQCHIIQQSYSDWAIFVHTIFGQSWYMARSIIYHCTFP